MTTQLTDANSISRLENTPDFVQDRIISLEHLLACVSHGKALDIDLRNLKILPDAGIAQQLTTKFIVWRASPRGCSISSATIIVPRGSYILLDGAGASFRSVTFIGATFVHFTAIHCSLYIFHELYALLVSPCFTSGVVKISQMLPAYALLASTLRRDP